MEPADLPSIDVATAAARTDAVLLDVREYEEFASGHAPAARHLPMSSLMNRVDELDKTEPLMCICRSGNRSGQVTAWLIGQGYVAVNVAGGMAGWDRAGLPVVNSSGRPGVVI